MNRNQVAAAERRNKERWPERYCSEPGCLWRPKSGPCPKHVGTLVSRVEALRIADEILARAERERSETPFPEDGQQCSPECHRCGGMGCQ